MRCHLTAEEWATLEEAARGVTPLPYNSGLTITPRARTLAQGVGHALGLRGSSNGWLMDSMGHGVARGWAEFVARRHQLLEPPEDAGPLLAVAEARRLAMSRALARARDCAEMAQRGDSFIAWSRLIEQIDAATG